MLSTTSLTEKNMSEDERIFEQRHEDRGRKRTKASRKLDDDEIELSQRSRASMKPKRNDEDRMKVSKPPRSSKKLLESDDYENGDPPDIMAVEEEKSVKKILLGQAQG
mmetsp:Transcript_14905/g.15007  ORF Transcript_14905/g.15007 Transcript_14905/m.15007 type:complete len:108 (+) Transcript_14905:788-1111(+)